MNLHKKGITDILVVLAFTAILILALSWLVYKILIFTNVLTPQLSCEWSTVQVGVTQYATAGLADIPIGCKAEYFTLKQSNLTDVLPTAQREIAAMHENYKRAPDAWKEIHDLYPTNSEAEQYEWALNRKIAEQLTSCWTKVLKGKFPLFDHWNNLIDWKGTKVTSVQDASVAYTAPGGLFKLYGPPTFCVYCASIKFNPDIQVKLGGKTTITSLPAWLRAQPSGLGSKESMFEYLLDDTLKQAPITQLQLQYTYSLTEPYAVEYVRTNTLGGGVTDALSNFFAGTGSGVDRSRLILIPDQYSIYPYGPEFKYSPESKYPVTCLQQIG